MFLQIYSKKESFFFLNSVLENIDLSSSLVDIRLSLFYFSNNNIYNLNSQNDYLFTVLYSEVSIDFSNFENFRSGFILITDSNTKIFNDKCVYSKNDSKLMINPLIIIKQISQNVSLTIYNSTFIGFSSSHNGTVYLIL